MPSNAAQAFWFPGMRGVPQTHRYNDTPEQKGANALAETRNFGFPGSVRFGHDHGRRVGKFDVELFPRTVEESFQRERAKEMHWNQKRRFERLHHLEHAVDIERIGAVDRNHHHIDAADLVELLLVQRVMQMAEMRDAEIGHLENENRIAVPLGAAAEVADIGRHIAHAHVADVRVMAHRLAVFLRPAAQHMRNFRIGPVGVMRRMRVVHGDDVGQAPASSHSRCSRSRSARASGFRSGRSNARHR